MKKLILLLIAFAPILIFAQPTPQQIDACNGTASGQNTYSVTISCNSFPTTNYVREKICVTYTLTNTGASTLKVNSQTPIGITLGGSALSSGDIVANQPYIMIYDIVGNKWALQKSGSGGGGGVSSVAATAPLASSGGATPTVTITQSGVGTDGYLSSTDWNTFNNKISSQWQTATTPTTAITYTVGQVGIGTPSTTATLQINAASTESTSATYALKVINGENNPRNLFSIGNDGHLIVGANASESMSIGFASGHILSASSNTFLGNQIALYLIPGSGFTGYGCTVVGNSAMANLRNGYGNTAVGVRAGAGSNYIDGLSNCFIGFEAGHDITSASYNNFMGFQCGNKMSTGSQNDAVGRLALNVNVSGIGNAAFGHASLNQNVGSYNTAIGNNSGQNATGSHNIFIGNFAGNYQTGVSNTWWLDGDDRSNAQGDKNGAPLHGTIDVATPANQITILNGKLYMKDINSPFNYWSGSIAGGVLTWTDTGSPNSP